MVDYKTIPGNKRFTIAAIATAILSYVLLCFSWFDNELPRPPSDPLIVIFLVVFLVSSAFLLRRRGFPRPFKDGADNKAFVAVMGITIVSRLPFLAGAYGLFSSDAAVQGVMALHIAGGRHHPVFLYRWSYIGTLKAHLTALFSWVSGEPVLSFAFVAILTYAAFAATVFALARVVLPRGEAFIASLYIVVAPSFLTAWGMHNEGNYVDVLAFGTAMLVLGSHMLREPEGRVRRAFWMGILGGLAFWAHILATYYLLAAMLVLVACDWSCRRSLTRLTAFLGGFVLGDLPGILWNTTNEWLSFRWWALDQSESADRVGRTLDQLKGVFTTSLAVMSGWWPTESPPWPGGFWRWALLLVVPACLIYFCFRFRHSLRPLLRGRLTPESYLVGFSLLVIAVFAQSSFGWMTEEPRPGSLRPSLFSSIYMEAVHTGSAPLKAIRSIGSSSERSKIWA
jgi:glycerol uptake facilitator-like aquaporin